MALYLNGNKISNSMVVNGVIQTNPVNISDFVFNNKVNTTVPTVTKISDYEFALSYQDQTSSGYEQCIFRVTLSAGTYVAQIKASIDKNPPYYSQYTWGIYSSSSYSNASAYPRTDGFSTYVPFVRTDTDEHTYYVPIVVRETGYSYICFTTSDDNGDNATVTVSSLKIYPAISVVGGDTTVYERLCYVTYVGHDTTEIPTISAIDTSADYSNYLSYDSTTKKFTVLQAFTGIITAWVYQYSQATVTQGEGEFYINDTMILHFQCTTINQGDVAGQTIQYEFEQGDTFYSYTPNSHGYPQQMLKVYVVLNDNLDLAGIMSFSNEDS